MADFAIHFFICNIFICIIIAVFFVIKHLLKNHLTNRMQYNLWFLILGLLAVPFLPVQTFSYTRLFSRIGNLNNISNTNTLAFPDGANITQTISETDMLKDFTISVSRGVPSFIANTILIIWIMGVLTMIILSIKSRMHLKLIENSALPLQNKEVYRLYQNCLDELKVKKSIHIYSTVFLKSPIITGLLRPRIYLPVRLVSDHTENELRYILLHELQHYKYMDSLGNYLMNLAGILYWFNPIVWYGLKEMRCDREIACDTCVLNILEEEDYEDYGNTLINFAESISIKPFPFAARLSGNMKQIKRRIINIAGYEKPSVSRKIRSAVAFTISFILLAGAAPVLSAYAADENYYQWDTSHKEITYTDVSDYFQEYDGSFVLYDLTADHWTIYNPERAKQRVSPNSTYKIYDALFGLESGRITPENSLMRWDNKIYSIKEWNQDQNLQSAMQNSVNWYFHAIDADLGRSAISNYIQDIKYGNQNLSDDLSSYWLESTLKISPVEQVELLTRLYENTLDFSPENIYAVKNSILISSAGQTKFYGKTGTGRVDGQDINGWFVGYVENQNNTYFFATNIQGDQHASGSNALDITLWLLSDLCGISNLSPSYMLYPLPAVQPD